ncbi:MAG: hypothetical protein JWL59_1400 [Chthoniobacteraceae bacterium]|nr:hypothetical protein [Chthoniobacteraceae bacterium]
MKLVERMKSFPSGEWPIPVEAARAIQAVPARGLRVALSLSCWG